MAMILDAIMDKCCTLLTNLVHEEFIMLLGVENELPKLLQTMKTIRFLLKDAEKRRFDKESSTYDWLSQLKDVMYDADDIIDLCRIKGTQLLGNQNSNSEPSPVCYNFSSSRFSCFTNIPLRHEIGNKIKKLNGRLNLIYENRNHLKLEKSEIPETPQITQVNTRQTFPMIDPLVVGGELEFATNELVNLLIAEKVDEKCRLFAVAGMGGIGKTTLAQNIINHQIIQTCFKFKVWVCVSQIYKETELLKEVIRGVNGDYGNANTKAELLRILRDSVASGESLFLVLDDVWRADIWLELFRFPFQNTNSSVRVLVTTRYADDVAKVMKAAHTHNVMPLSIEASWDMYRRLLFKDEEEQLANDLKEIGLNILERCGGLPLAIKAIAGVLDTRKTRTEWEQILGSDIWSISNLHENHIAALQLSFEDLPSHLKQCFLYFSLCREDQDLNCRQFAQLWVAEGFLTENKENSLMEDVAERYFSEFLGRNLLLSSHSSRGSTVCKIHDMVRSLALFLSEEETSCGDVNLKNHITFTKLRRLSIEDNDSREATNLFDLVAKKGALRTLLAKKSDLLLDDERLRRLSCLRVLNISQTGMEKLPDSIGNLVHLRYLDLSWTRINAIPESIKHLAYLQFLNIRHCGNLKQLPYGITQLHHLRYLNMRDTDISFMPEGIEKLQQLNRLRGFPMANKYTSSKLEALNSLKQIRSLRIENIKGAQSDAILLKELPHLSNLTLVFSDHPLDLNGEDARKEQWLAVRLFHKIIPPRSLQKLKIHSFYGPRFPNWMALSSSENYVPNLTILKLSYIKSCTQLPPLGQLPQLRELEIDVVKKVKQIGQEFLGGGVNSTTRIRIAFPKLEQFSISNMDELEDWSFGAQVEENASPRLERFSIMNMDELEDWSSGAEAEENASPRLKLLPCLRTLKIRNCPLLKQLPKGLKHSAMKSLSIDSIERLKSLDELPPEIEELQLRGIKNLEKICCPSLKELFIYHCPSLSSVEKLDSLQILIFEDELMESLPNWLLEFLQQREQQNDTDKDFLLWLRCSKKVFQECLEGGSYWDLIQHIPRVIANDYDGRSLCYNKHADVHIEDVKFSD